jgi:hypothetical protein
MPANGFVKQSTEFKSRSVSRGQTVNKQYCEKVRISAMAIVDGEAGELSKKQVDEHLEVCGVCREELGIQEQAIGLLEGQTRRPFTEDVSCAIAAAIGGYEGKPERGRDLRAFVLLGVILLGYRIVEVLPNFTPGLVIKLLPLVPVFVFFGFIRHNPFEINQNLRLQGDIR